MLHSMPNHLQQKNTNYLVQNIRSAAVEKLTQIHWIQLDELNWADHPVLAITDAEFWLKGYVFQIGEILHLLK